MDMNLSMKEEFIKRNKEEINLLNEQNQRLVRTMEAESRNTTKITDEYVTLREETVQTTIALEAARKKTAILTEEVKNLKSENAMNQRHECGQNVILDTIQQLQQQMTEQRVADEMRLKSDLKSAQLEVAGFREQIDTMSLQREDVEKRAKEKEEDIAKKLDEEKQKVQTISQELQRVKQRQLLAFSKTGQQSAPATSPGRTASTTQMSNMELKRLGDEIRTLKSEKERLTAEMEDFKKIATDSERRMNESMEGATRVGLLKDKEIKEVLATVATHQERVTQLQAEIQQLKNTDGAADIQQLHTKVANLEHELKTTSDACLTKDTEITQVRQSWSESVIQHGRAQEEAVNWKSRVQEKESEITELQQSCEVQKARNDQMMNDWGKETEELNKKVEHQAEMNEQQNRKNQLLHDQLNQLNEVTKNTRRRASISSLDTSNAEGADESNLLELSSIMRRETSIAESERDLAKSESIRANQKIRNLEAQLEQCQTALTELEEMKSKPQITSEQHQELMQQVNQLNILRESNSVLRDEKARIRADNEAALKKVKDLERQIEPLLRTESDMKGLLDKKEIEIQEINDSIAKIKSDHIEQIKKLNQSRISNDQVKKIVNERDTVSLIIHTNSIRPGICFKYTGYSIITRVSRGRYWAKNGAFLTPYRPRKNGCNYKEVTTGNSV